MTRHHILPLLLALATASCGSASQTSGTPVAKKDAGAGMDGSGLGPRDAASADLPGKGDGRTRDVTAANVFADAPSYNWGAAGAGGAQGGMGGSTAQSMGGMTGSGGKTLVGGSSGSGGARQDAALPMDAPSKIDGGPGFGDGGPEAGADVRPDIATTDARTTDVLPACVASIVPVLPVAFPEPHPMVARPYTRIVLRAQVAAGSVAPDQPWDWKARLNNSQPISVDERNPQDPGAAAFVIADEGDYTFTASAGTCIAMFSRSARRAGGCTNCDYGTDLQIVAPATYGLPTQWGYYNYFQWTPSQGIVLAESHIVKFFTSVGSQLVASYVRINNPDGSLVTDGYLEPSVGFRRPLLVVTGKSDLARYQVLVVPQDGEAGTGVAASAPQLFVDRLTTDLENGAILNLSGGVTVTGTTLTAQGQPAQDVRVMLNNQDPAGPAKPDKLVFSSVGRSDAQGAYTLHAQPGQYWVTVAPDVESGLSEAIDPSPISLLGNATVSFTWLPPSTAPLTLQVLDAAGRIAGKTRVLVSAKQSMPVGTLTFRAADGTQATHTANSNVHMEQTTDESTGLVVFPALPADATYSVLLIPEKSSPLATTTELSLLLPAAGASQPVSLAAEAFILGQLTATIAAPDWSQVQIVAFDKSRLVPEAPRVVWANPDGSFSLNVSPGRPYAVVAWPPADSGLARTFIGPGLLQSSPFRNTQQVQATMDWTSSVSIASNGQDLAIVGAALQTTCHPGYWRCTDPTIPLAETTSGDDGTFTLKVPDPATW